MPNPGIYSTPKQWDPIVGTVSSSSPLTGGGTVTVVQWTTKPVNRDLACRG